MKYLNAAQRLSSKAKELIFVLIDLSPSMESDDYQPSRKDGAIEANKRLIETKAELFPEDQIGIIDFGETAHLLHAPVPAGAGFADLCKAMRQKLPDSCGTDFTAALELTERCLFCRQKPNTPQGLLGRIFREMFLEPEVQNSRNIQKPNVSGNITRRIIMLTDGEHNGDGCPVQIARRLKDAGVIIECIGIAGSRDEVDEKILKKIASPDETGRPRYCFIGDTSSLIRKYKSMANQIRPV
jgi:hypothetical protein